MRDTFIKELIALAEQDEDIFLLTADLGFKIFDEFIEKFPDRFINVGVAEANMIGVAAGLALNGKKPYCYSIAPFLIMRPFEQIRVDLCYHNLDVKLVGSGGGITYSMEGITHHAIEDIAILRALPNMSVVCPGDIHEIKALSKAAHKHKGPMYIRLPKTSPPIHENTPELEIGKGNVLLEGKEIVILTTGNMLSTGYEVAKDLISKGVEAGFISMHTVKPIDKKLILSLIDTTSAIYTIEEHSRIGGLGSAVSDILAENQYSGLFKMFALDDSYCDSIGSHDCLRQKFNLNSENIIKRINKE